MNSHNMNNNTETSQAIMFMQNMMTNMMVQLQKNNERAEKNEQLVNELMRMQRESVQVKSENAFSSVPSTTVHPSSIPASSHQHSSTPASSSIHSSSRVSMKNSSSPAPASPSSSPTSSPVRNRSRSKAEKVVSSSIKRSKEEVKIMKNERRKERDEEEIYESVSDDDPYASYLAFLIKRQQLYPFERNEYVYDNSFTLYSESGRLCEYIRFMIMCAADEKLYPPSTRRWYDFKVSEFTGSIKKQHQRDVKDTAVIFPQLSLDDRDVRYNVKSSEDADIPINSYALLGTPVSLHAGTRKTLKFTTASKIFEVLYAERTQTSSAIFDVPTSHNIHQYSSSTQSSGLRSSYNAPSSIVENFKSMKIGCCENVCHTQH
jgi:hypothetical protein